MNWITKARRLFICRLTGSIYWSVVVILMIVQKSADGVLGMFGFCCLIGAILSGYYVISFENSNSHREKEAFQILQETWNKDKKQVPI